MKKAKRVFKEIVWFICSVAGGFLLFLFLYDLLNVDINLRVMVLGVIVVLLAVYVVRAVLCVFKASM